MIRLHNLTGSPVRVLKHDRLCEIRSTVSLNNCGYMSEIVHPLQHRDTPGSDFSRQANLDPNKIMPNEVRANF